MISVITPAVPERVGMLAECIASVTAQTLQPVEHLIRIDHEHAGTAATTNQLAEAAKGEWLALIADDDLMFPDHLEKLAAANADIAYSEPKVEGERWARIGPIDAVGIRQGRGTPPSTCLIRRDLWVALGGYRGGRFDTEMPEDMDLWRRAAQLDVDIKHVPDVTWVYRFHGRNQSRGWRP